MKTETKTVTLYANGSLFGLPAKTVFEGPLCEDTLDRFGLDFEVFRAGMQPKDCPSNRAYVEHPTGLSLYKPRAKRYTVKLLRGGMRAIFSRHTNKDDAAARAAVLADLHTVGSAPIFDNYLITVDASGYYR